MVNGQVARYKDFIDFGHLYSEKELIHGLDLYSATISASD